jgi:hypothetical protein
MKKTILSLATVALLSIGVSMAQRGYTPNTNRNPAPYNTPSNDKYDDMKEDINIDRLDAIVNLTRKQEREVKRIEDRYDVRGNFGPQRKNSQMDQRFLAQKQKEILDVLTPKQREKWFAFQQSNRFDQDKFHGRRG